MIAIATALLRMRPGIQASLLVSVIAAVPVSTSAAVDDMVPSVSDRTDVQTDAPAPKQPESGNAEDLKKATGEDSSQQAEPKKDDDTDIDKAEPDFTVITLPTTARLPRHKSAFRLTHRFTRALNQGDFGDLASDFFGFDGGAQIGLEYRFGIMRGTQAGIYRTSDRTIQFFGEREIVRQSETVPVSVSALIAVEGTNNFRDSYSPSLGAVISRSIGGRAALYAQPIWVNNSNLLPSELADHNDSFLLGLGGRANLHGSLYGVVEWVPRLAGYDPGRHALAFGVEGVVGGHVFQLNFSNNIGTTMAQVARGGLDNDDWYIGFNLSRKFW
jgi:hypothetical protein